MESKLPKIHDIPIELIDPFPNHPFKVRMDDDMYQLVESIKEQGLITPLLLRPKEDGPGIMRDTMQSQSQRLQGFRISRRQRRFVSPQKAQPQAGQDFDSDRQRNQEQRLCKWSHRLSSCTQPHVKAYVCDKNERSRSRYQGHSRHHGTPRSRNHS